MRTNKSSKLKISKICLIILGLGVIKLLSLSSILLYSSTFNPSIEVLSSDINKIIAENKISNTSFSNQAIAAENDPNQATTQADTTNTPATQNAPQTNAPVPTQANTTAPNATPSQAPVAPAPQTSRNNLVPNVSSRPSPIGVENFVRADEVSPGTNLPVPQVSPIEPSDSAKRKEEELNRREQELIQLQQQMNSRLEELQNTENRLGNMVQEATNTEDQKIKHLIDVYANMKPKQAAQTLATLDEKIAVKILQGLKGRQAGEILSYMDADNAARLSEALTKMQMN